MMKKLILTILLFVLPISLIDAYPNEPSGYASMYWGESHNKVKARYNTSFLRYNQARTGALYMVTIPNAYGELGMLGRVNVICFFDNDRLSHITIPIFRKPEEIENTYRDSLRDLKSICGTPKYFANSAVWNGNITMMGLAKNEAGVAIELMDVRYLHKIMNEAARKGK